MENTNKGKWVIGLIIVVVVVVISWSMLQNKSESTQKEIITIGAILPMTGDMADYGNDEFVALNLFIDEWNSKNEQKIKLVAEDSKSLPVTAVSAFNKLILIDKPNTVLSIGSSISLAIQPLSNEKKIPTMAVAGNSQTANGYMIQNLPTNDDYVKKIIEELKNKKIQKIGIIYRNDDLGLGVKESFIKDFDGEIVGMEAVSPEESDFRTVITKNKAKNPEAIFVVHTGKKLGLLISQIRTLAGNIPIYSTLEINYPEVKETAGASFRNIIYSDLNIDYSRPALKSFKDQYLLKGKREPSLDSILAYNEMILISSCLNYRQQEMLNCLSKTKVDGLTGLLYVENNRVVYSDSMVIKEIK